MIPPIPHLQIFSSKYTALTSLLPIAVIKVKYSAAEDRVIDTSFTNKDHLNYNIAGMKSIDTFANICSFPIWFLSFSPYEFPICHPTTPHSLFPKNRTSNKFRLIISIPAKRALLETSAHSSNQFAHLSQTYRAVRIDNVIACIV